MRRYEDYRKDKSKEHLSKQELKSVKWTGYKIIVPTEEDKEELMEAFNHFHDQGFDSDFVTANQLAHEYLHGENILVNPKAYEFFNTKK